MELVLTVGQRYGRVKINLSGDFLVGIKMGIFTVGTRRKISRSGDGIKEMRKMDILSKLSKVSKYFKSAFLRKVNWKQLGNSKCDLKLT